MTLAEIKERPVSLSRMLYLSWNCLAQVEGSFLSPGETGSESTHSYNTIMSTSFWFSY